ncbi:MAG: alpha/beta hydrolase [Ectothiorhodospiraceae bacterium]|nr:alpha/beta hydrolase [Ectothiorhodospiraceae bacterium]
MKHESVWRSFTAADGTEIHYRHWANGDTPRAAVQLVHGAAEHSGRYDRFAQGLVDAGYAVYGSDHRGHGRTRLRSGELGDAGPDGWNRFVLDEIELSEHIRNEHPRAKLALFGHSMGSFIAQDYLTRRDDLLDALIMCGTTYTPALAAPMPMDAIRSAAVEAPLAPSEIWAGMFVSFNEPFSDEPGFDWLSRDPQEVQKYLDDPQCGFVFNNELVRDLFVGALDLGDPARQARVPKQLPILVIQGAKDPVGGNLEGTQVLIDHYKQLNLTSLEHRFYPDARHELLNETNRDEVESDVLAWLKSALP